MIQLHTSSVERRGVSTVCVCGLSLEEKAVTREFIMGRIDNLTELSMG